MDILKEKRTEVSKMTYGYVRVSSRDQNEERQIIAMHEFGIRTDGKDGFQLCFYALENDLFQFLSVDFQIMAWTGFIRL